MIKILQYPNPRLKTVGEYVDEVNDNVRQIVDDMFETLYHSKNCAALAATQLDFDKPKRITVIDFSPEKNQPLCLINPEIIHREGEHIEIEGCMSVMPDHIHEKVKRAAKIRVKALDRNGKPIEFEAEGFMAKCIQHELDHLDGLLYLDRIPEFKKQRIDKKITKLKRQMKKSED